MIPRLSIIRLATHVPDKEKVLSILRHMHDEQAEGQAGLRAIPEGLEELEMFVLYEQQSLVELCQRQDKTLRALRIC